MVDVDFRPRVDSLRPSPTSSSSPLPPPPEVINVLTVSGAPGRPLGGGRGLGGAPRGQCQWNTSRRAAPSQLSAGTRQFSFTAVNFNGTWFYGWRVNYFLLGWGGVRWGEEGGGVPFAVEELSRNLLLLLLSRFPALDNVGCSFEIGLNVPVTPSIDRSGPLLPPPFPTPSIQRLPPAWRLIPGVVLAGADPRVGSGLAISRPSPFSPLPSPPPPPPPPFSLTSVAGGGGSCCGLIKSNWSLSH